MLGVTWYRQQRDIAQALIQHRRVMVKAGNGPGKTFLAAGLTLWHFDCFRPSLTLTTAPTQVQVQDVLWKEIRRQCPEHICRFFQPKAPRIETSSDHYAVGYTAANGSAFQGRHEGNLLIIFDEATGIGGEFWDAADGMLTSGERNMMLAILNPTDISSRAREEEDSGRWHVISLNTLEHPNILAELEGQPAPIPTAVRLGWVREKISAWASPVTGELESTDFVFEGRAYRPGPLFESRVLGRWPSSGGTSVWTDALWRAALNPQALQDAPTEIGCDVARFGDDFTEIVVRRGAAALHHEAHNGWSTSETAGRLKQLCREFAGEHETPTSIAVKIDDDGVGGGVTDQAAGYRFVPVRSGARALESESYPNRRSELWFAVADMAREGRLDLSRLTPESLRDMRVQAFAPTWKLDSQGRRVVEPKADTKRRLKRSPDSMDALNLAFARGAVMETSDELYTAFWRDEEGDGLRDWD